MNTESNVQKIVTELTSFVYRQIKEGTIKKNLIAKLKARGVNKEVIDLIIHLAAKKYRTSEKIAAYTQVQTFYKESYLIKFLVENSFHRQILWHIALPKSGSSWLTSILSLLLMSKKWKTSQLVPFFGRRSQEIDPRCFITGGAMTENIFYTHQHCPFSEYTEYLIKCSGLTAFFQTRNIFDVAVSLFDHYQKIRKSKPVNITSWIKDDVTCPKGWQSWHDDVLLNYVIDIEIPWFVKMIDGWLSSDLVKYGVSHNKISIIRYEELVNDPVDIVLKLLNDMNIPDFTKEDVTVVLNKLGKNNTRFNKGIVGRGSQMLSEKQIKKIEDYISYSQYIDDKPIVS